MANVYTTTRTCHKLLSIDQVNSTLSSLNENGYEQRIKCLAIFKGFITRNDFDVMSQKISESKGKHETHVYDSRHRVLDQKSEALVSKIGIFEYKDRFFFADIANVSEDLLIEEQLYMVYGKFESVDGDVPVFFCNLLSHIGKVNDDIFETVHGLLKIKGIVN